MPWKECHVMDERLRLVASLLAGEKMAPLCVLRRLTESSRPGPSPRLQLRRPLRRSKHRHSGDRHHHTFSNGTHVTSFQQAPGSDQPGQP